MAEVGKVPYVPRRRVPGQCLLCSTPASPESRDTTAPLCPAHDAELDAFLASVQQDLRDEAEAGALLAAHRKRVA